MVSNLLREASLNPQTDEVNPGALVIAQELAWFQAWPSMMAFLIKWQITGERLYFLAKQHPDLYAFGQRVIDVMASPWDSKYLINHEPHRTKMIQLLMPAKPKTLGDEMFVYSFPKSYSDPQGYQLEQGTSDTPVIRPRRYRETVTGTKYTLVKPALGASWVVRVEGQTGNLTRSLSGCDIDKDGLTGLVAARISDDTSSRFYVKEFQFWQELIIQARAEKAAFEEGHVFIGDSFLLEEDLWRVQELREDGFIALNEGLGRQQKFNQLPSKAQLHLTSNLEEAARLFHKASGRDLYQETPVDEA